MKSTFGVQKTATTVAPLTANPVSTTNTGLGSFTPMSNPTVSAPTGITFGSLSSTSATTFNNPAAPGLTTTTAAGFTLPSSTSASGWGGLGTTFGQQPATTAPTFGLGMFPTPSTSTTSLLGTSTTTSGFSIGAPATSATTGFSLGIPQTTTSTGFTLGLASTTTSTGFTLGAATSATTGFSLDKSATTTIASSLTTPATTAVATSSLPVSSSPTLKNAAAQVKFSQLEENINKWTIELEEQEKVFMNQVAHINEWDRLLLSNGDKIVNLNNSVEKLKLEQQQLDHELDFIVAQQRELEECLLPLEKEFADVTVTDPERDATYRLAENLNTQLRHMSEDLKEIIEDINEKNKNQDTTDPIVQIGRILNAHMNSLQWVDQNTTLIKQQLDQVNKLAEIHRRENDSTQNL